MDLSVKLAREDEKKDEAPEAKEKTEAVVGTDPKTQMLFADGVRQTVPEAVKLASELLGYLPRLIAEAGGDWQLPAGMSVESAIKINRDRLKESEARCLALADSHERNNVEINKVLEIVERVPPGERIGDADAETIINATASALHNVKALIQALAWLVSIHALGSSLLGIENGGDMSLVTQGVCGIYKKDHPEGKDCPGCRLKSLSLETLCALATQRLTRNLLLEAMGLRLAVPLEKDRAAVKMSVDRIVARVRDIEAAFYAGPAH